MGFGRLRFRRSFGQVKSQFRGATPKHYPISKGVDNYIRPDGTSLYHRTDGTSLYKRPLGAGFTFGFPITLS